MTEYILQATLFLIALKVAGQLLLNHLNRREIQRHQFAVPAGFEETMDEETYRKSVSYSVAKNRLHTIDIVYDGVVLALLLSFYFFPFLLNVFREYLGADPWADALFLLAAGVLLSLVSLPLDWWSQFRLEERFGFNRTTLGLWLSDLFKGLLISFVLGFPLLWALLTMVDWLGDAWWLGGFVLFFGFQLLMMVLYPLFVMPLFNKFTPLPEGPLRDRLLRLADRTGFAAADIQVMDGSRRSSHSNAFFTGLGSFRKIVLFDTLIEQLTEEELEAVLAHEIGHYKKGHILKRLVLAAVMVFAGFYILSVLARQNWFLEGFGFPPEAGLAPAFLLFGLIGGLLTFWLTPLSNLFSRKHEYEADAFAREAVNGPEPLIGALRKLTEKNLSNLTPHPLFSGFYYSHPTLIERERKLKEG